MNIKTKTFQVTPKQLKQLLINHYFKARKKILIMYTVMSIIFLILAFFDKYFINSVIFFSFLLIGLLVAPFLINMKKTQPVVNFIPRYWEIDENFISIYYEDGSLSKFRFDHLIKATKQSEFYLVYFSIQQFYYLPLAAFETEKDIHRFELFLEGKQLLKLW
jgi:hypothetical protein